MGQTGKEASMGHQHVDIVKNEWLAGFQVMVARARLDEQGTILVETNDPAMREVVLRPVGAHDPERNPEDFLRHLSEAIHGTYLFATELHDDGACPFRNVIVPIHADQLRQPA
jgi:hypothetical protein